jgi:phage terminase small subunit
MKQRGRKSAAHVATITSLRRVPAADRFKADSGPPPPPPEHLRPATKAWWLAVLDDFELARHEYRTLQVAAEAWDRKEQAREAVIAHGLTFTDDKGMIRARPEVQIERDARIAYLRALRELNLDTEPPEPVGLTGWPLQR